MNKPRVISINISSGGIPKKPVDMISISRSGLQGDGHNHDKHNRPTQAVSLQDCERLEDLCREGYSLYPGATGENLTLRDAGINLLPLGTQLIFTGGVILELTRIRKPCYVLDAIDPQLKEDIAGRCGMYAAVLSEGKIRAHDEFKIVLPVPSIESVCHQSV